ncbi:hypothetical protein KAREA_30620 [Prescottella equi]|nr:hypothetical protein KAREA_30620 [Prescottella equi]
MLRRLEVPLRFRQAGAGLRADGAAPGGDEVGGRRHLGLRRRQVLIETRACPLGLPVRLLCLGQDGVQAGIGLHHLGETAERVGVLGGLRILQRRLRGGLRLRELRSALFRERSGGVDALLHVGHRCGQGRDGVPDVGVGAIDRVEQLASLVERALGGADRDDCRALLARRKRRGLTAGLDVLLREGDPFACHGRVVVHGRQHRRRELTAECGERGLGLGDADGEGHHGLGEGVESGGGVEQQVAHRIEFGDTGIELAVGALAGRDEFDQHLPLLLGRLGDVVVEALTDRERRRERRLGPVVRGGERRGRVRPELADGQVQFLLAGANGVVHLHQFVLRERVERRDRQRRQRGGVGRIDLPCLRDRRLQSVTSLLARVQVHAGTGHDDHADTDAEDLQRRVGRGHRVPQPARRGDRGTGPIVLAQSGLHQVLTNRFELGVGDLRECLGDVEVVVAGVRRDREERVPVPESAQLRRLLAPCLTRQTVEVRGIDHPETDLVFVVQRVEGVLDVCPLPGVEDPGGIGDVVRQPQRRLGRRGRGCEHESE